MFSSKISLFSKTKSLENSVNNFHDKVIEASITFRKAIQTFLSSEDANERKKINKKIKDIEHEADILRRQIENELYTQNILPNMQAEIFKLVESLDKIINNFNEVVFKFYIEKPEIPQNIHAKVIELSHLVANCVEYMAIASRAFFNDLSVVRDYSLKVYLMEKEADAIYNSLKKSIFGSSLPLANKLQLDSFITQVSSIADNAEDCADELAIFVLKRDI